MKRNKQITIDEEIYDYLQTKENSSAIINQLLKNWMQDEELENLNYEQIKAEQEILKMQKELDNKARELRENARIK